MHKINFVNQNSACEVKKIPVFIANDFLKKAYFRKVKCII